MAEWDLLRSDQLPDRPLRRCSFAGELRQQVRAGFDAHSAPKDAYGTKYLLSDGRAQLKQLRDMLSLQEYT